MTFLEAVFLGVLQGVTEFLPVSSSGHLVVAQHFLGVNDGGILFEVLVHFATLVAVVAVYRNDILAIIKRPFQKYTFLLIVGTIPTGIIGVMFKDAFERLFNSVSVVGYTLIVTGGILFIAEIVSRVIMGSKELKSWQAFVIGIGQGMAITPGISRSGTTIAVGLLSGLDREEAARFSFLISLPAIFGASLLEAKDIVFAPQSVGNEILPYAAGMIAAGVTGYLAIKLLLGMLNKGKLYYFSIYCWIIGAITIFLT